MIEKIKIDIRNSNLQDIEKYFIEIGEKKFRAKQVYEWIWKKGVQSFDEMSNLSLSIREKLNQDFHFNPIKISSISHSSDDTQKLFFLLSDNLHIESVLIPASTRITACISSQTGCNLKCKFCASGTIKNGRNLSVGEIYDQIITLNKHSRKEFGKPLSNIVFMGIGEPFLNYDNVKRAISILTSESGFNMSPKRITVSTAGIIDKIKSFTEDRLNVKLAISLHAADNLKRTNIMPINKSNPLDKLKSMISYYNKTTGNSVTLEYLLLHHYNDSKNDAKDLFLFCKNLNIKVNIIEYNPVQNSIYKKSSFERMESFKKVLEDKNIIVTVRNSKGNEISAACGQLASRLNTGILKINP